MKPNLEQLRVLEQTLIAARGRVQVAIVETARVESLLVEARELVHAAIAQIDDLLPRSTTLTCSCPAPGCRKHRGGLAAR